MGFFVSNLISFGTGVDTVNIALSAEAWAALAVIVAPLVGAFAANIKLTFAVRDLTTQMTAVKAAVNNLPNLEARLMKLEGEPPTRRRRRANR
jgi:hypothetical protein